MQKKVSILIPVYNTAPYLAACLDSVLAQTEMDWEAILIDDGSEDESGTICDAYANMDSRFRVFHQKNHGVSATRNFALTLAEGEYIGFVDSDDTIAPDMYESLLQTAKRYYADIVMCDTVSVYENGNTEPDTLAVLDASTWVERADWTPSMLLEMAGSACRCIYRRELLLEKQIQFPVGLRLSEDRIFNIYAMGYANGVAYCKEPFYQRRMRQGSAVHKFYPDFFDIVKDGAQRTQTALMNAWNGEFRFCQAYLSQFVGGALCAVNNYFYKTSTLSFKERREKMRELCTDADLRHAIETTGFGGIRGKWILKNRTGLLGLCARFLNRKHRR